MTERGGRIFGGLAALAVLWIIVYWAWEPGRVVVTYDPAPGDGDSMAAGPVIDPVREARRGPESLPGSGSRPPALSERREVAPPAPNAATPAPAAPAVIPPQFRDYTIRDGDTLEGIARREMGSARHVEAIRAANPLMSPDRLQIGRVIRLPLDPTNIQGRPNPDPAQPPAAEPREAPPDPTGPVPEYIVKSGDTLSRIARSIYGSTSYDEFIYQANRDRLRSKDDLQIGQKLRIPPRPRE